MHSITTFRSLPRSLLRSLFLALLLALSRSTFALQIVDVADGTSAYATISIKEITRLSISGERLRAVKFNPGTLLVDKDEENGQFFLRVQNASAPINVFVVSESGRNYALVLQPKDIPLEQIILRDSARTAGYGTRSEALSSIEKASSHQSLVKNFVLLMASGELPKDLDILSENKETPLWKEAKLVHLLSYKGTEVIGEKFQLTNLTDSLLRVAEQEFYAKGVLGVAIDQMALAPKESTMIYLVRQRGERDGN